MTPTIIVPSRSTEHHVEFVPELLCFAKKAHKNQFTPSSPHSFSSIAASPNPSTMISAANLLSPPNNIPPKCRNLHPPLSYSLCLSRRSSRRAFWWLCHRRILSAARARPSTPPSTADLPPPPLQRLQTTQNDVSPTLSSHCLLLRCRSVYSEPPRDNEQAIEFRLRKDLILQRNCFSVFGFC